MRYDLKYWLSSVFVSLAVLAAIFFVFEFLLPDQNYQTEEVMVVIPEGKSIVAIDKILHDAEVLPPSESLLSIDQSLEGYLFPDTYRFYKNSAAVVVVEKFLNTFREKAQPILNRDLANFNTNLIIASIIEREVPDLEDRKIVAGLLKKRLAVDMPLQVDASLCYIKETNNFLSKTRLTREANAVTVDEEAKTCYPLTKTDKAIDSPYNTYLYKGLPPGPIGNPGTEALLATVEAKDSPYWYYISDPDTGRTIFSRTLEEHNDNIYTYLIGR